MSFYDSLLPPGAVVVEASSEAFWEDGLLPEEAAHISQAVERRRREFTAGRNCARQALARLGLPPVAIKTGAHREPIFPAEVSGTITHTADYCAAAVLRRGETLSIGIDAEETKPLGADVARMILTPEEQNMIQILTGRNSCELYDKIIFSAKEAFYKSYFQITQRYLDFLEATVILFPSEHIFEIRTLATDVAPYFRANAFRGRYVCDGARIYTAIGLPAIPPPSSRARAVPSPSGRQD